MSKRMTTGSITHALRKPSRRLLHLSDRGAQHTSHAYRKQLSKYGMQNSIPSRGTKVSGKGSCYDNAVVERFFGCLKYEWLANVIHLIRD